MVFNFLNDIHSRLNDFLITINKDEYKDSIEPDNLIDPCGSFNFNSVIPISIRRDSDDDVKETIIEFKMYAYSGCILERRIQCNLSSHIDMVHKFNSVSNKK